MRGKPTIAEKITGVIEPPVIDPQKQKNITDGFFDQILDYLNSDDNASMCELIAIFENLYNIFKSQRENLPEIKKIAFQNKLIGRRDIKDEFYSSDTY